MRLKIILYFINSILFLIGIGVVYFVANVWIGSEEDMIRVVSSNKIQHAVDRLTGCILVILFVLGSTYLFNLLILILNNEIQMYKKSVQRMILYELIIYLILAALFVFIFIKNHQ